LIHLPKEGTKGTKSAKKNLILDNGGARFNAHSPSSAWALVTIQAFLRALRALRAFFSLSEALVSMKIALIQQHATRDKAANVARGLVNLETAARNGAALACYAELAFEWFHPQRPASGNVHDLAEPLAGPTVTAFQRKARELGIVTLINLFERDGGHAYDSSPVIDADGSLLGVTRMIHITDYACFHEQGYYTPGDKGAPVYDTQAGRVGIAICYDRHFPEYMRALALDDAELVVVPQAGAVGEWPDGLYEAELRVAAFQNGYFTALWNRVGREYCIYFSG
jgi:N-carbamoylputrescine amidase